MNTLIRDTFFGLTVKMASGNRLLKHPEERQGFVVPERYRSVGGLAQGDSSRSSIRTMTERDGRTPRTRAEELSAKASLPRDDSPDTLVADRLPKSDKVTAEAEAGEDANLVDWYGPDDPENPLNWSTPRKVFVTLCICLITTAIYMGSSVYVPAVHAAAEDMGVGEVPALLGISMFVLGYGVGPLFLSPLSEIPSFGRNPTYIVTLFVFVIVQIPTALTRNFPAFIILRFIAGFAGSPPLATGGASIADIFGPTTRPFGIGAWGLACAAGPVLGPVLAGFIVEAENWHWHAWLLLIIGGASLIFLTLALPETSEQNILLRRARRLRALTGNQNLRSAGEIEQSEMAPSAVIFEALVRPLTLATMEPIAIALNLYTGFVYAVLYCWFECIPIVFLEGYGWSLGVAQLPYIPQFLGETVGFLGYVAWNQWSYIPAYKKASGNLPPEARLPPAYIGSLCYPIALFWFGWTANSTHWFWPCASTVFFGAGTSLMFNGALNYLPDAYPKYAASILAGNDFVRALFGAGFPLFSRRLFTVLGINWGCSLLGFISIALMAIPVVLIKYGAAIRAKSKVAL